MQVREGRCELCSELLHVLNCKRCGRSCPCYLVPPREVKSVSEPLTADWEKDILKAFITRHGAANVRDAVSKLEAQLG